MEKAWRNGQADLMKFSKEKCKVLLLERNNSLGANLLENSFAEKNLGIRVEQLT